MTSVGGPNSVLGDVARRSELERTEERNRSHHCITCSDEGCPLTVVRVDADRGLALCEAPDGERSTVEIALIDGAAPGAVLLVHAGTALALLEAVA